jgi:hypothetical protein
MAAVSRWRLQATRTLSKTESEPKSRMFWKVRAMPQLDDLVDAQAGERAAVEPDGAGGGLVDAGHEVEDGGLAGAVGADEAAEFALADGEVHGVHRGEAAELDRGLVELEERGHGGIYDF